MTQDELFDQIEDERERLLEAIEGLPQEALLEAGVVGDWSIKDILAHLSGWEAELVKLLWNAKQGEKPKGEYFTGAPIDEINARWHAASQDRPLESVVDDFRGVRKQVLRRLENFSDEELNDPRRYSWLKDRPLWMWIAEGTYKHDAEHGEQIRAWRAKKGI